MRIKAMFPYHPEQRLCETFLTGVLIMLCGLWAGCSRDQGSTEVIPGSEPTVGIFTSSLFGLDFLDGEKGWAVGKLGGIAHTDDGGKNWWAEKSGIDFHLFDVCFADAQNGWAVGDMGSIIHTADGGANWDQQKSTTENILRGVEFTDAVRGWVVGDFATMLKTENGGKEWIPRDDVKAILATRKQEFLPALLDITFVDEKRGWAVGYPGIILSTTDGGNRWEFQESGTDAVLSCVDFADDLHGLIAGNGGMILRTDDGGKNWAAQESGVVTDLLRVAAPDQNSAWVVTYGGILHSGDGGRSWTAQESGIGQWFYTIAFPDTVNGWAVGDFGTIYHTSDAGRTWAVQAAKRKSF